MTPLFRDRYWNARIHVTPGMYDKFQEHRHLIEDHVCLDAWPEFLPGVGLLEFLVRAPQLPEVPLNQPLPILMPTFKARPGDRKVYLFSLTDESGENIV